jgi:23S rRNA G2445 N2-methylase RlmL
VAELMFGDASRQAVELLGLMALEYDVVLMNPPFGAAALDSKKTFEKLYPKTKNDLYAAFVERGLDLLYPGGRLGAITSRTGFFLKTFTKWREDILLGMGHLDVVADLGYGVLDKAMVETAAYVVERR